MLMVNQLIGFGGYSAGGIGGIDSFTKLMLRATGADGSTGFTDVSSAGHTITVNGDAQVDTAQNKFGKSALFDGASDSLTCSDQADWEFGSSAFTIDFWHRSASFGATRTLLSKRDSTSNFGPYHIAANSSGDLLWSMSSDNASWDLANNRTAVAALSTNTWYHFALVRNGTSIVAYHNGTNVDSITSSATLSDNTTALYIGAQPLGFSWNGWIEELRISKGIARWTANFTPPTQPYST